MKTTRIKQILNDAFESETPNLLLKIKEETSKRVQIEPTLYKEKKESINTFNLVFKRFISCIVAFAMFIGGIFVGNLDLLPLKDNVEASIYLDVNPSIEIKIDDNKVIKCIAGNNEGNNVLQNISLDGVDVGTALYAIVGSMYANGYLNSSSNSILVSIENYTNDDVILLDDISKQIDNVFEGNEEMQCSIIAQEVISNDNLSDLSRTYDISIGKMHLVNKIISNSDVYTEKNTEVLAAMNIHELNLIYQSLNIEENEAGVTSGKPNGFIESVEALECVLNYLNITIEDVSFYEFFVLHHHNEFEERKMLFCVSIILEGEDTKTKYIVDCNSGEIMPEETVDEWKDVIFNDGSFGGPKDESNNNHRNEDNNHQSIEHN